MDIKQAPQGVNVVVELDRTVYIGRLGKRLGDQVQLHKAAVFEVGAGENTEELIRRTARYGVPVEHEDLVFAARDVRRVRKLGEIPKA